MVFIDLIKTNVIDFISVNLILLSVITISIIPLVLHSKYFTEGGKLIVKGAISGLGVAGGKVAGEALIEKFKDSGNSSDSNGNKNSGNSSNSGNQNEGNSNNSGNKGTSSK